MVIPFIFIKFRWLPNNLGFIRFLFEKLLAEIQKIGSLVVKPRGVDYNYK
jgi:hypothetical protein